MIKPITHKERKMCLGKAKHKSKLAAINNLIEIQKFAKHPKTLNWYECDFCGEYHVGNNQNLK